MTRERASKKSRRLLRQPGGFEGVQLIAETPKPNDSPLVDDSKPCRWLIEGDAASFCTGEGSSKQQHLVAEVPELLGFDPKLRPSRIDVSPELLVAIQPSVDDALRPADDCRTNLYLGMENRRRRPVVPIGKRRKNDLATSTFSCDITYSDSPAASRAFCR